MYPKAVGAQKLMSLRSDEDIDGFKPYAAGAIRTATSSMSVTLTTMGRMSTTMTRGIRIAILASVSPEWLAKAYDLSSWAFVVLSHPPIIRPISTTEVESLANPASFRQ